MGIITITSALILLFSLLFISKRNKTKSTSKNKESISVNYKILIDEILHENKHARIESEKINSIKIQASGTRDGATFSLNEVPGRIIIAWSWTGSGFGKRGKEWSFPGHYDQVKMYEEILDDVIHYQNSVYQKYNQKMTVTTA